MGEIFDESIERLLDDGCCDGDIYATCGKLHYYSSLKLEQIEHSNQVTDH